MTESRPDDIPQDVWDAASTAAREAIRDSFQDPLMPMQHYLTPYIARAIMADRERCANQVRDMPCVEYVASDEDRPDLIFERGAGQQSLAIEAAIRKGTP